MQAFPGLALASAGQVMTSAKITVHKGDLPASVRFGNAVAVDSETLGLRPHRDRLCVVQLSAGDGTAHLVQLSQTGYDAPNLKALLTDQSVLKIFHFRALRRRRHEALSRC